MILVHNLHEYIIYAYCKKKTNSGISKQHSHYFKHLLQSFLSWVFPKSAKFYKYWSNKIRSFQWHSLRFPIQTLTNSFSSMPGIILAYISSQTFVAAVTVYTQARINNWCLGITKTKDICCIFTNGCHFNGLRATMRLYQTRCNHRWATRMRSQNHGYWCAITALV